VCDVVGAYIVYDVVGGVSMVCMMLLMCVLCMILSVRSVYALLCGCLVCMTTLVRGPLACATVGLEFSKCEAAGGGKVLQDSKGGAFVPVTARLELRQAGLV